MPSDNDAYVACIVFTLKRRQLGTVQWRVRKGGRPYGMSPQCPATFLLAIRLSARAALQACYVDMCIMYAV